MRIATPFAILTVLVAAVASPPVLRAETTGSGPSAVVAEPVIDAGELPVGEPAEAEFLIENQGDEPLEILRVQPACGCTVAEYDETIAPGETGRVRAVVDTTSEIGPNSKLVTVVTNDPDNPQIRLTIESDVKAFVALQPGYARFASFVQSDRDQSIPQILWTDSFEELEITGVESSEPWLEVTYREATEAERVVAGAGKQWRVDVTLAKTAPIGPVAERALLRTNHPQQKVVEIPVSGFVRPIVAVLPPDLDLGRIDTADPKQHGVLVRNFGSTPLEVELAESTVGGVDVSVETLEVGQQFRLVLTPTIDMAKGPFSGRVELRTNLPQQPILVVNLEGEVL